MLGFWTKYNKIPVKSLLGQGSVEGRQQQILGSKEEVYEKGVCMFIINTGQDIQYSQHRCVIHTRSHPQSLVPYLHTFLGASY